MPIPVVCAACHTKLVAPDAAAGKKVKCKNCQSVIVVPEPEESDFEFVDSAPVAPAKPMATKPVVAAVSVKPKSKPAIVIDDGDDEFDFTASPKKSKSKAVIEDDDDEETPKPKRKSKPAVVEDEDDDEEYDAPKRRQKSKKAKAKSNPLKFVVIGVVALLAVGFLGAMVWYVAIRDDKPVLSGPLAGGTGGSSQPKDPLAGWTKHEKTGYSLYFKDSFGAPETKSGVQAGVKVEAFTAGAGPGSRNGLLMVSTEFPPATFAAVKNNPAAVFDSSEAKMAQDGKVLSKKDITVDGNPGREFKLQKSDGSEGLFRMVLAHNRLYLYGVVEPGISESSETYRTFFDNVKLKP